MSDIYQSNLIATFHRLGSPRLEDLEAELVRLSRRYRLALVLPALYSEFEGDALPGILDQLPRASYVDDIVMVLGRAGPEQFRHALTKLARLPQKTHLICVDSPRIQQVLDAIRDAELYVGEDGKGRSVWLACGYVLGLGTCDALALHDCDILTYKPDLLARLAYPVMNRNLGFEFVKGYYARVTDKLYGRVTRLFISPLIRALIALVGHRPFLNYLDDFRYPLSGEMAMSTELARLNRIPAGWGLEVGTLAEVYRNLNPKRVCQVDLADNYEHKHQPLSPEDPEKGLLKMCVDISRSIFFTLSSEGVIFSEGLFRSLQVVYRRTAEDTIRKFAGDALINGLTFDRHDEGKAVETFAHGLQLGGEQFLADPTGAAQIPNWSRVADALPDIHERLVAAVQEDTAEA